MAWNLRSKACTLQDFDPFLHMLLNSTDRVSLPMLMCHTMQKRAQVLNLCREWE